MGSMTIESQPLEDKTQSITENGTYSITPSAGYAGINSASVDVNVSGGGGGSVETCTLTISGWTLGLQSTLGIVETVDSYEKNALYGLPEIIRKNSFIYICSNSNSLTITGEYERMSGTSDTEALLYITGDVSIYFPKSS